jgi:hypothetical protein
LVLQPASGAAGTVAVTACPLSGGFTPVLAGPWDQAPAYNCTVASVDGVTAPDGTITFALTAEFVAAGNTAMQAALVPTPGAAPFQVPIEAPGDGSFAAIPGAPVSNAGASNTASDLGSGSAEGSFDPFSGALPTFETGPVETPPASGAPQVAVRPATPRPRPALPVAATRGIADRLAAVAGLALIGAAMWWMAGRPVPIPKLLAGASTGEAVVADRTHVGGIGRFARPRQSPPNRF